MKLRVPALPSCFLPPPGLLPPVLFFILGYIPGGCSLAPHEGGTAGFSRRLKHAPTTRGPLLSCARSVAPQHMQNAPQFECALAPVQFDYILRASRTRVLVRRYLLWPRFPLSLYAGLDGNNPRPLVLNPKSAVAFLDALLMLLPSEESPTGMCASCNALCTRLSWGRHLLCSTRSLRLAFLASEPAVAQVHRSEILRNA